jgi:ABC-type phosphate/phosphonate transport system substrate-binding protein
MLPERYPLRLNRAKNLYAHYVPLYRAKQKGKSLMNRFPYIAPKRRAIHMPSFPVVMACILLLQAPVRAAENPAAVNAQNLIAGDLSVGFSERAFAGVNHNDAEAAFKAFLAIVGRQRGYNLVTRMETFKNAPDFETAIRRGTLQLSFIPTWDYLDMNIQDFTDPVFVSMVEDGVMDTYLLLAHQHKGLNSLTDLRGKSIAVMEGVNAYLSMNWLEMILLQQKQPKPNAFFGHIEKVSKASSAVLPVFFGKYDGCIVDAASFNTMKELNPQVGMKLRTVVASEPLLSIVACMNKSGWLSARHKEDTRLALGDLHTTPTGQQILTLFRTKKLLPFKSQYMESVKKLKAEHKRLSAE